MTGIPKPKDGRFGFQGSEEALQAEYDALIARHVAAGWNEAALALAIERLAQEHIATLAGDEVAEVLAAAQSDAQFYRLGVADEDEPAWVRKSPAAYRALAIFAATAPLLIGAFVAIWLAA
ncbi:MAG: hypothetical protein KL840_08295 [Aquamicrobium sp.]|nr:hypothetical protein [Aquamicrobium sp.]